MPTKQISVERFSVISQKPFSTIVGRLNAALCHPPLPVFWKAVARTKSFPALEKAIRKMLGPSGFMEFVRFDHDAILWRAYGDKTPRLTRLLIGNPLIMKQMVEHVPDAGSYAPVTILIDERPDGVHLSYDRMASFLAPYQNQQALRVARDLDAKIEALLTAAAR
jgi:uncharacterized protein (DUF302 family)